MEDVLVGQVERIVYSDPARSFAVAVVRLPGGSTCTVTGPVADLEPGVRYRFEGRWVRHPRHGLRFRCTGYSPALASGAELRDLLATSVRGVGEELAERIVETLGPHALEVILESPTALTRVPGLGPRRAEAIRAQLLRFVAEQDLARRLAPFGLEAGDAVRLLEVFGYDAWTVFETDPYAAARALGKRWADADRWAARMGRSPAHFGRLRGALREVLVGAVADGHVCLPRDEVLLRVHRMLHGAPSAFAEPVPMALVLEQARWMLAVDRSLVERAGHWFLPAMDVAEEQAARHLKRLTARQPPLSAGEPLERVVAECTAALGIRLAPEQEAAVRAVLGGDRPVIVVTGGPGTGKSTVARAIVDAFRAVSGDPIFLAAPTGLAAKNLGHRCGMEGSTLHRLLEASRDGPLTRFRRHADNPLPRGLYVVDETSMVDLELAAAFLAAVPEGSRICFLGDEDQLPPVGPGQFFTDLMASGRVTIVRLTTVYRQAQDSRIVRVAHEVRQGKMPAAFGEPDCVYRPVRGPEEAVQHVLALAEKSLVDGEPFVVLVPQRRGEYGAESINRRLQALFNPPRPGVDELVVQGRPFRVGDRVLQTQNLYDGERLLVPNGAIGEVVAVSGSALRVRFDGEEVEIAGSALATLTHAWAITVHKSQGLEFGGTVVLLLLRAHAGMLSRSLVYTAITRAKTKLVVVDEVGEGEGMLQRAIRTVLRNRRHSLLLQRLAGGLEGG